MKYILLYNGLCDVKEITQAEALDIYLEILCPKSCVPFEETKNYAIEAIVCCEENKVFEIERDDCLLQIVKPR